MQFISFAKYHTLAFLGSNLLKSSDVFLIGAFLGPTAIAIYSIPLRLVQLVETPLKSAIAVAFPILAGHDNKNDKKALSATLEEYIGVLTILYVPFMAILYLLSKPLVLLIGGDEYADSVIIFQVFLIYGLFLPFDRLTGITLDAMGMPQLNFYKVLIMASVNIIGDLMVIYFFESLEFIAVITVTNVLAGVFVGYVMVKRKIELQLKNILKRGGNVIRRSVQKAYESINLKKLSS